MPLFPVAGLGKNVVQKAGNGGQVRRI